MAEANADLVDHQDGLESEESMELLQYLWRVLRGPLPPDFLPPRAVHYIGGEVEPPRPDYVKDER